MARRTAQVFPRGGAFGYRGGPSSMVAAIVVLALLTLLVVIDGGDGAV